MFDVQKIRRDFPMLNRENPTIFLDNASTTFKPQCVIQAVSDYYSNYCSNIHEGDYDISYQAQKEFDNAREKIAKFINADSREICFTAGDTASMNILAFAISDTLEPGDEVLLTVAEHASNILPWFKKQEEKHIVINYIPLTANGRLTVENVAKTISPKTRVISIANITNVLGYTVDVKAICELAHKHNILVVIDGAQGVPRTKTDVKDWDCDFLAFSSHKMCGPTGVGVLYGKYEHLLKLTPPFMGGGMNSRFDTCGNYSLMLPPLKFEFGTQHIAGVIGFGAAIDYIESIGIEKISEYERKLKAYAVKRLQAEVPNIKIYNADNDSGIITFNIEGIFAQDLATHFNAHNICVRSGQHCAKILLDYLGTAATVRASVYFYNTKEEIDAFVEAAKKGEDYLDAFFE